MRFSTNQDYGSARLLGGYWEKFVIDDQMNFNYLADSAVQRGQPRLHAAVRTACRRSGRSRLLRE